jgi:Fic family protein
MTPFTPHTLPLDHLDWYEFVSLIGSAHAEVARFDTLLQTIPNAQLLLAPLTTNEAVLSSKIEGAQATLEDVYAFQAHPSVKMERYDDIQEVINYRKAMNDAIAQLEELPLSARVIRNVHKTLMSGVRGEKRTPGEFRTGMVHIGKPGSDIQHASYVPPEPQVVPECFSNLEKYIHYTDKDPLVQLAIIHAQFEIIHPFWDGNGRTGRILLPLFLFYRKVISTPNFYPSEYFEKHRESYYHGLNDISRCGYWECWITYFLKAIIEQSRINTQKVEIILELYRKMLDSVRDITHSQYTHSIVDFIFSNPLFDTSSFRMYSDVPRTSAFRILKLLNKNDIITLIQKGTGRNSNTYIFPELIKILEQAQNK